ncbi:hypothetical protein A3742_00015 [Oleiphilus sp. HI0071]|nr:hypothetical protein A3737_15100 [Oleiphilus sp. HI0065]KZY89286.1 hypothetical protein A3744_06660 [Oleiphilus sp. HI0073]KZY90369.1 hypothetical protein A3742_00015 [Oleiphilus sp. HI0071]KZZ15039.1 hypothetical protein A3750_12465 [Oleiphilus sp. HI0079]KZZ16600.1 hypothetical protein A3751_14355 [Oleiphilus sp. HI0080]KZZ51318.1 hypothetical protein A3760_01710 [Oleiphilus sp. HI0122]KZZ52649.1 hypothetical protein A3758_10935 [Oleiphilus sp. HI0118]KZZ74996.1 hypothetical protein A37
METNAVSQPAEAVDYASVDQGTESGDGIATLRKGLPIDGEFEPARMPVTVESSEPRKREYPMQPPTIPHKIGGYEINLNVNKCMSCHGRSRIEESGAKMVSVTHYQDRDHQSLASISATRFFCTQCHVVQTDAKPLVENDFVDMDKLLK